MERKQIAATHQHQTRLLFEDRRKERAAHHNQLGLMTEDRDKERASHQNQIGSMIEDRDQERRWMAEAYESQLRLTETSINARPNQSINYIYNAPPASHSDLLGIDQYEDEDEDEDEDPQNLV